MENNSVLKIEDKKHVCSKIQYFPDKYFDLQIIRKPNYEILENCNTKSGNALIIFNPNNQSQCHEYRWRKDMKLFRCMSCDLTVNIHNASKETEYVELLQLNHECEYRQFNREKYFKFKDFVLSPDFEIRTEMFGERKKKSLIIFNENDRTKCYIYYYNTTNKAYQCINCSRKKAWVSAKMEQNSDGEKYIILSNAKHICEMVKYEPQKSNDIILRAPNIKFMEKTSNGTPKLFIFDSNNKSLCYIFSKVTGEKNRYHCLGYFEIRPNRNGKSDGKLVIFDTNDKSLCYEYFFVTRIKCFICGNCQRKKHRVSAKVHLNNETNEKFLELSKNEHICKPIKDEFADKIINASNFIVTERDDERKPKKVIVFTSSTKEFYYELNYTPSKDLFQCVPCSKRNKAVGAKLYKKENGEEYLISLKNKHVCAPKKYEKEKLQPKIISKSMFELYQNKNW
uniref:Uncharacterized protein n=1 Tax=Panagrolaimus davidi TaxID=227884 RepID=A0A914QN39_9BILA